MADPSVPSERLSQSYQQVPEDLFVLVQYGVLDHQQFFVLALFHKYTEYKKTGSVALSLEIISERTNIPTRTLVRRVSDLVKKELLLKEQSAIKGAKGYPVTKYAINWQRLHKLAAPIRLMPKPAHRVLEPGGGPDPNWRRCPNCRQWVSPFSKMATDEFRKHRPQQGPPPKSKPVAPQRPLLVPVEAGGPVPDDIQGWHKVRWGMALTEVAALYGPRVRECHYPPASRNSDLPVLEIPQAVVGTLRAHVAFYRRSASAAINAVVLSLSDANRHLKTVAVFGMMREQLEEMYGQPTDRVMDKAARTFSMWWRFQSTAIELRCSNEGGADVVTVRFAEREHVEKRMDAPGGSARSDDEEPDF